MSDSTAGTDQEECHSSSSDSSSNYKSNSNSNSQRIDIDDVFDAIASAEQDFVRMGEMQGFEIRSERAYNEGYELGCTQGDKFGLEVGFIHGFVDSLKFSPIYEQCNLQRNRSFLLLVKELSRITFKQESKSKSTNANSNSNSNSGSSSSSKQCTTDIPIPNGTTATATATTTTTSSETQASAEPNDFDLESQSKLLRIWFKSLVKSLHCMDWFITDDDSSDNKMPETLKLFLIQSSKSYYESQSHSPSKESLF